MLSFIDTRYAPGAAVADAGRAGKAQPQLRAGGSVHLAQPHARWPAGVGLFPPPTTSAPSTGDLVVVYLHRIRRTAEEHRRPQYFRY